MDPNPGATLVTWTLAEYKASERWLHPLVEDAWQQEPANEWITDWLLNAACRVAQDFSDAGVPPMDHAGLFPPSTPRVRMALCSLGYGQLEVARFWICCRHYVHSACVLEFGDFPDMERIPWFWWLYQEQPQQASSLSTAVAELLTFTDHH